VSPEPVNSRPLPPTFGGIPGLTGTSGMADMLKNYRGTSGQQG
jgi:hypothetical protein